MEMRFNSRMSLRLRNFDYILENWYSEVYFVSKNTRIYSYLRIKYLIVTFFSV